MMLASGARRLPSATLLSRARAWLRVSPLVMAALMLAACAKSPLTRSGSLLSYEGLERSDSALTQTQFRVSKEPVLAARSVTILPVVIAEEARTAKLTTEQLELVANTINRALCAGLSERFRVVSPPQTADLAVQAFITALSPTDVAAASVSSIASIGGSVAGSVIGVPVRVPRLPIGLGGLSVEAQALTSKKRQLAAMIWARGADVITTRPRASEEADAYALATEFGGDFAHLLVTGNDPSKRPLLTLPSAQSVGEFFGSDPKEEACGKFGRNPGLGGAFGGFVGLPPKATDAGSKR